MTRLALPANRFQSTVVAAKLDSREGVADEASSALQLFGFEARARRCLVPGSDPDHSVVMKAIARILVLGSSLVAAAAFAQGDVPAGPETLRLGPSTDPAQIVCVRETELGSRIRFRRVCRTRAQWRELRRDVRNELDRVLHPTSGG